jgi:hypothetical protein
MDHKKGSHIIKKLSSSLFGWKELSQNAFVNEKADNSVLNGNFEATDSRTFLIGSGLQLHSCYG